MAPNRIQPDHALLTKPTETNAPIAHRAKRRDELLMSACMNLSPNERNFRPYSYWLSRPLGRINVIHSAQETSVQATLQDNYFVRSRIGSQLDGVPCSDLFVVANRLGGSEAGMHDPPVMRSVREHRSLGHVRGPMLRSAPTFLVQAEQAGERFCTVIAGDAQPVAPTDRQPAALRLPAACR